LIDRLSIENFKTIESLDLSCSRVNLFIGKPNTGKSNILESLGILSWMDSCTNSGMDRFIRMQSPQNLFRNEETTNDIKISFHIKERRYDLDVSSQEDTVRIVLNFNDEKKIPCGILYYPGGEIKNKDRDSLMDGFFGFKYYQYERLGKFEDNRTDHLIPPNGENLFSLITSNKEYKEKMRSFFRPYDIEVVFKPQDRTFEVFTREGDDIFSHPYISVSDTFQRMIFYLMAIESNKDSILVFEEPEVHSFPTYVKMLAQVIADDRANQYFISSHNPYLFETILEKTDLDELKVNIVDYSRNRTEVKQVSNEMLSDMMDTDPFFNIDRFFEG